MKPFGILKPLFLILLALAPFGASPAHAVIRIDVTGGNVRPLPIAVTDFSAANPEATPDGALGILSRRVSEVIRADLQSSGLFRSIDPAAFTSAVSYDKVALPDFAPWRTVAAQALVTGFLKLNADGTVVVGCYLFDVFAEEPIAKQGFMVAEPRQWRRAAHKCADIIYSQLTGDTGYFDTRIAYIAETGPKKNRVKRLAIMDQDGANIEYLSSGQSLVLTPRFAPGGRQITFLSYAGGAPRATLLDLTTRKQEVLGRFPGITFAPRFSPDGSQIALTSSAGGNTDIQIYDLASRQSRAITRSPYIDTSPSWSPDGKRIVFESNRGGSQQLYVMNADGSAVQRLSFDRAGGKARYGSPSWSPRGDWIAFTKIDEGKLRIGVMRTDGGGERLLTDSWQDESPSWSPNGRVILFFRTQKGANGSVSIHAIDVTGQNERRIPTPTDASDPAWSPLLP